MLIETEIVIANGTETGIVIENETAIRTKTVIGKIDPKSLPVPNLSVS